MAARERMVKLLPFLPTDPGSIEAWLNTYAERGWRFSERVLLWQGIVFRAKHPEEGRILYRLKSTRSDRVLERCLHEEGWKRHPERIAGYEVWCKRTIDPDEGPYDTPLPDGSEDLRQRGIVLVSLLLGIEELLEGVVDASHVGGMSPLPVGRAQAIISLILGLTLIVYWILCRRNLEVTPGTAARFFSGLLTPLIVFGVIVDFCLMFA